MKLKITKFVHSCLLVETPDRVAIFDPGSMSQSSFDVSKLARLDDIFITHVHADHMSLPFIKELVARFPGARITTTNETIKQLAAEGIKASNTPPAGAQFFDSPHEDIYPPALAPEEVGIHYLDSMSQPGDSHSFRESKAILALPMQAPWGSSVAAFNLALELKPSHVLPIHDWHWRDEARESTYNMFEERLAQQGITFHKLQTGQPVEIEL